MAAPLSAGRAGRRWPGPRGATVLWGALVVVVLAAATGWQVLPSPGHWGSQFATNVGDPVFLMWQMEEQSHHLGAPLQGNIFFPHSDTLAYSDALIAYLPVFAPVLRLSGDNPVAAYNAVAFLGYLAGALAVYALAQHLLADRPAALLAALLFTVAPYRSAAVGHVQLVGVCFLPLTLLFAMRFLERRRWRDAALVGLMAGLCWLGSLYAAMMLAISLPAFVAVWLALHWRERGPRLWRGTALAAAASAVLTLPTLPAYLRVERSGLITRRADQLITAKPSSFGALPPSGLYRLLGHGQTLFDSTALYPGTVLLLLAAAGVVAAATACRAAWRRSSGGGVEAVRTGWEALRDQAGDDLAARRRRAYALPLLAAGLVCMLVMVGPNRTVLVSGPDRLLRAALPGMASVRDLTRFWLVPLLLVALLAGAGVREVCRRVRPQAALAVAAALVLIGGAELLYRQDTAAVDLSAARTAANRDLAALPAGAVVELPLAAPDTFAYAFTVAPDQLRSLVDDRPRVEGYSGEIPDDVRRLIAAAQRLPDPAALQTLRAAGVRYLLLHGADRPCTGEYGPAEMAALLGALRSQGGAVEDVVSSARDAIVVLRAAGRGTLAEPAAGPAATPPQRAAPPCDLS